MTTRQRVKLAIVCAVIGAVANLVVAWIAVSDQATFSFATGEPLSEQESKAVWARYAVRSTQPATVEGQFFRKKGVIEVFVFPVNPSAGLDHGGITDWVCEWRCGWPYPSFRTGADFLPTDRVFKNAVHNPKPFQFAGVGLGEFLPYCPMFPGVLINTIFYAGVVWMAIRGPAEMRRRWRELKGKCGRCGFVRTGAPACVQCGTDLTHAWGQTPGASPSSVGG